MECEVRELKVSLLHSNLIPLRQLYQLIDIPAPSTDPSAPPRIVQSLILGVVKRIHVRNAVLNPQGLVDPVKFQPLARLGGNSYGGLGRVYDIPRPVWSHWEPQVTELENKIKEGEAKM